jgi:hypothetical protein
MTLKTIRFLSVKQLITLSTQGLSLNTMKKTIEQLHLAAQYLAAAGISFVKKEDDDSHTNLGWNSDKSRMETHVFGTNKNQLAFNLNSTSLEWLESGQILESFDLSKNKHLEIVAWISSQSVKSGLAQSYAYQFHYDLPYKAIADLDTFTFNKEDLKEVTQTFSIAQQAFDEFLSSNNLDSPIRIWPHHFDLGIYTALNSTFFMGAGLAIPDSLVDDLYYYASGYNHGTAVLTKGFSGLSKGNWRSDWDGATLAASQTDKNTAINFLNEVRIGFLDNL